MKVRHYPGHAEPVHHLDDTKSMAAQYENNWKECDTKWRVNERSRIKTNSKSSNNSNSWSYEQYSRTPVLNNYPRANSIADIGDNDLTILRIPGEDAQRHKPDLRTIHPNGFEPVNITLLPHTKTADSLNSCQTYVEPEPSNTRPSQDFHKSKESINVERLDQIIHNPNANPLRYYNRQRVAPELIDDSWIPPPESVNVSSSQSLSRRSFHVKNNVPNTLKRVKSLHANTIKDVFDQKERKSSLHGPAVTSDLLVNNVIPQSTREHDVWDVVPPLSQNKPLDLKRQDSGSSLKLEKNGKKPQRSSPVEIEPDYPVQTESSSNGDFIIPRPKLIVPVHTYGVRKRRTGANVSKRKGSEEVDVTPKTGLDLMDKKHHTSWPGKQPSTYSVVSMY